MRTKNGKLYSSKADWIIGDLKLPPTPPHPPLAAKFSSQGDAHVRTDAQVKFLYYPLACHIMILSWTTATPEFLFATSVILIKKLTDDLLTISVTFTRFYKIGNILM